MVFQTLKYNSYLSSDTGLTHIREIDDASDTDTLTDQPSTISFLGAALPPVPHKLAEKIESGAFVDMGELLPGNLSLTEEEPKQKSKHYRVSRITEWLQGFAVYVAVLSHNQPARIPDLMGYQLLILEAYHKFKDACWLGYDRRFRQWAASHPRTRWAAIEPTLWSLAFQGQARSSRCKYCFSLSHSSVECELSVEPFPRRWPVHQKQDSSPRLPCRAICYQWNDTPSPICTYPNCRYDHICYICAMSSTARSVDHKAMHCPYRSANNQPAPAPLRRQFTSLHNT